MPRSSRPTRHLPTATTGCADIMCAPLTSAAQATFRERFGVEPWVDVYGQTECMPTTLTRCRRIGATLPAAVSPRPTWTWRYSMTTATS